MHGVDALAFLEDWFADRWVALALAAQRELMRRLPEIGIHGGATYDALIGATAAAEAATLVTADRRALSTYERVGVEVELVG